MNLTQIKAILPTYFDSNVSVELLSSPGMGKSDVVEQLVGELSERDGEEWGYAELFLATQTPPDLLGYMMPETKDFGDGPVRVSSWTMPAWMMCKNGKPVTQYKRGILFLDEYGQGEADVKRASAQLLLKKALGPWQLPEGWAIVAASNRATDRSGVTKSFDFVITRRAELHVTPDLGAWNDWAHTSGVSPTTLTFVNQHPEIVFSGEVPEKQGPTCNPRTIVMFDKVLQNYTKSGRPTDTPEALTMAVSLIGEAASRAYFVFLRLEDEMPKFETIIDNPEKVKVPAKPDGKMLVTYHLAHRVAPDTMEPVVKYLSRFGDEFGVTFIKAAAKRDPNIARTPAFIEWCRKNSALMAAVR
jgi:hypothetical protein